jgi:hypothetical protein
MIIILNLHSVTKLSGWLLFSGGRNPLNLQNSGVIVTIPTFEFISQLADYIYILESSQLCFTQIIWQLKFVIVRFFIKQKRKHS